MVGNYSRVSRARYSGSARFRASSPRPLGVAPSCGGKPGLCSSHKETGELSVISGLPAQPRREYAVISEISFLFFVLLIALALRPGGLQNRAGCFSIKGLSETLGRGGGRSALSRRRCS